ncbi:hypothetical protein P3L10_004715 [Capsicum annuum]
MAAFITNYLLEWGLDTIYSITVDNASSNDVTMIEMSKQLNNWGTNIMEGQHLYFKECCESQLITYKKSLCLDVPTRWNSTYLMLETAQHFELAFERYSFYDNGFLDYLRTSPCEDETRTDTFVSEDWENLRMMVKFLKTFYDFTLKVSSSKYVTTNVHFY